MSISKLSIKVTANTKTLSSYSGLHLFSDLISKFEFQSLIGPFLPKKQRERGFSSFQKLYAGILGFVAGAECLDDFDWLGHDPLFEQITGSPSSITMGKFLRAFSPRQVEQIRNLLPNIALKIRLWLDPKLYKIEFRMDGTLHEQYGEKMEGVEWNYKKFRSLSSQNLFDDKGLCYGFNLRSGATHSSIGAVEMMESAFKIIPKSIQKYFVADSAYATEAIYNTLLNHSVNFAICLPEIVWGSLLKNYGNKITWHQTRIRFFKSNKCEVGDIIYPKKGLSMGRKFLRVVFIRTKKTEILPGDNHPYLYYAIVTDMGHAEMTNEKVIQFYRKRAQVENNIKDLKNGIDFHHFPCQSLKANNVWGLMGILAYNLMRMASFSLFPRTGCFINTTRRRLVTLAGELIKHARSIEIRMMDYLAKGVNRLRMIFSGSFYKAENADEASPPNGGLGLA
jgi:hypothetical protein